MKLRFDHGNLYVDNVRICFYERSDNGSQDIPPGSYPVEARYAHTFGKLLPHVDGLGWLGADTGVQIILGRVRAQHHLIPDGHLVRVLVEAIEAHVDAGDSVLAEVV